MVFTLFCALGIKKQRYIYSVVGTPTSENTGIYAVLSMWQDDFVHTKVTETQFQGSLKVKLPTIWTDGKAEVGRVREEKGRRKKIREEKGRRKKIKVCEKVEKSRNTLFSECFVAPEGRKVGSLKRRVRSHLGR